MDLLRRLGRIWRRTGAGIFVPDGSVSDFSARTVKTYLQLKGRAAEIQRVYTQNEVTIPPQCDLALLIADAGALSDAWLVNDMKAVDKNLLRGAVLDRVADVVLLLEQERNRSVYLRKLVDGNLNLLVPERSVAKDILWELELWASFKTRGFAVELRDPPDIVVTLDGKELAVACKKLYSEANLSKVLSDAVHQVEAGYKFGVAAVNLDSLFASGPLQKFADERGATEAIDGFNRDFVARNDRFFRKYLDRKRLMAVWISTGLLVDLANQRTRLNNFRHATVWLLPGLPDDQKAVSEQFFRTYFPN